MEHPDEMPLPDAAEFMEWGSDGVTEWMERKIRSLHAEGRPPTEEEEDTLAEMATFVLVMAFIKRGIDYDLAVKLAYKAMDAGDIKITCTATEFSITTGVDPDE